MSDEETKAPDSPEAPDSREGEPPAGEAAESSAPPEVDEAAEQAKAEAAAKAKAEAAAKAKAAKEAAEAAKPPWQRDPAVPEWVDAADDPVAAGALETHGDGVLWARTIAGDLVLMVEREAIREVARTLHDDYGYTLLLDICGADYGEREELPRFEVIYHLMNLDTAQRVRMRLATDEESQVPTLVPIWRGANWPEREVFDMYGITFADHPDMTRILMWEGFNGHPLRKDFPVEGIDTGTAIYPEYYDESAGPVAGTGTGWRPPPEESAEEDAEGAATGEAEETEQKGAS